MGVALIADRRLTNRDGSQPEYGDKITGEIWGMLTAFSGDRGTFELFRNRLRHYVRTSKKDEEQSNQKLHNSDIDEILWQIHKIKTEVTYQKGGYKFELMVGVSSQYFAHKKSVLDYFSVDGGYIPVDRCKAIGDGEIYASYYLRRYYDENMRMKEFAGLGDYIIRLVDNEEYLSD